MAPAVLNAPARSAPTRTAESRPSLKSVPVDQLVIYPNVQRDPPSRDSVKKIADSLDYSKLGVLDVSLRADGSYSVIDGQRRMLALKSRNLGSYRVSCLVYSGLSEQQEAEMFLGLNATRVVSAFDRFKVGLTARRPDCVDINTVFKKHGWKISKASNSGVAACINSMQKVWARDKNGALLNRVVATLSEAFGRDKNTMSGSLVEGLAQFFVSNKDADDSALVGKLRARFSAPVTITTMARNRQATERGALCANVSAVIERVYNSRRQRA